MPTIRTAVQAGALWTLLGGMLLTLAAGGRPPAPVTPGTPTMTVVGVPTPVPKATGTIAATETPGPTPTSVPTPADPYSIYQPLDLIDPSEGTVLEKSDFVDLDGNVLKKALITISIPPIISATNAVPFANLTYTNTRAALAVVGYDPVAVRWKILYHTAGTGVPGRAVPLPAAVQGQDLLHTTPPLPILQLRTEVTPTLGSGIPTVELHLYGWKNNTAQPLRMLRPGAAADEDAVFTGAADVQLVDIDNDGRAEVVVDDGAKTTIWKWDGVRFVPR